MRHHKTKLIIAFFEKGDHPYPLSPFSKQLNSLFIAWKQILVLVEWWVLMPIEDDCGVFSDTLHSCLDVNQILSNLFIDNISSKSAWKLPKFLFGYFLVLHMMFYEVFKPILTKVYWGKFALNWILHWKIVLYYKCNLFNIYIIINWYLVYWLPLIPFGPNIKL